MPASMKLGRRTGHRTAARTVLPAIACGAVLALAAPAAAHVERASYWPDPAAEIVGGQPAGGAVPQPRSLSSALDAAAPSDTRVVCQGGAVPLPRNGAEKAAYEKALKANPSMSALDASIADAQAHGYKLRPTGSVIRFSKAEGKQLREINKNLLAQCGFDSIQAAVNASGNNDRVVIMPGTYTEPASRAAPTFDPTCKPSLDETNDRGDTGAVSYKYQATCPNDQNLIAVIGRAVTDTPVPQPPALDRHGIPDAGPCIRCNLQMEGSGVKPDDVTVDAGRVASGDGAPIDSVKDVGVRADRADGFVIKNMKVRHAGEHDVYEMETDGFLLDRVKMPYAGDYGLLTFVADHSLIENCDAWGNGDSGIYPGASADLGDAVPPDQRRYGTELRDCDSHHNAGGYSGTDGNAVWIHNNNFYDNTLGFTVDVFTAPGHPGFPQDSDLIENNNFYSNNFNTYLPECPDGVTPGPAVPGQSPTAPGGNCSDVAPTIPVPIGTGMWIAGGNHNIFRNNHVWDNWRRGSMLFAVPDQLVCGPAGSVDPSQLAGCDPAHVPPSTSYNNQFYGNSMSRRSDGTPDPNGTDFWWDEFAGNTGNCWHDNTGKDGTRASLTAQPPINPVPGASSLPTDIPFFLPEKCATSTGTSGPAQDAELVSCLANFQEGAPTPCDWFTTPAEPAP
jgi:hypothetical protein